MKIKCSNDRYTTLTLDKHIDKYPELIEVLINDILERALRESNSKINELNRSFDYLFDFMTKKKIEGIKGYRDITVDILENYKASGLKRYGSDRTICTYAWWIKDHIQRMLDDITYGMKGVRCKDGKYMIFKFNEQGISTGNIAQKLQNDFTVMAKRSPASKLSYTHSGLCHLLKFMNENYTKRYSNLDHIDAKDMELFKEYLISKELSISTIDNYIKVIKRYLREMTGNINYINEEKKEVICKDGKKTKYTLERYVKKYPELTKLIEADINRMAIRHDSGAMKRIIPSIKKYLKYMLDCNSGDISSLRNLKLKDIALFEKSLIESGCANGTAKYDRRNFELYMRECSGNKRLKKDVYKVIKCNDGKNVGLKFHRYETRLPLFVSNMESMLMLKSKTLSSFRIRKIAVALDYFIGFLDEISHYDCKSFEDINIAIYRQYNSYLPEKIKNTHISLELIQNFYTFLTRNSSVLNNDLPNIPAIDYKPLEPYSSVVMDQIIVSIKKYIDEIRRKEAIVQKSLKYGKVVTYKEEDYEKLYSLNNIVWWFENEMSGEFPRSSSDPSRYNMVSKRIKQCSELKEGITVDEFRDEYMDKRYKKLKCKGRDPRGLGDRNVKLKLYDAIKIHVDTGEPLYKNLKKKGHYRSYCEMVLNRLSRPRVEHAPVFDMEEIHSANDLYGYIWPTLEERMVMLMCLTIQTGWNPESVISMSEHELSKVLDDNLCVLIGGKRKGQQKAGSGVKYSKDVYAVSNYSDKYSAYRIFKLLERRSERINKIIKEMDINASNQGVWNYQTARGVDGLKETLGGKFWTPISRWVKRQNIIDENGNKLKSIDIRRFRPTWNSIKSTDMLDNQFLSLMMAHTKQAVTDIHYDNHSEAKNRRNVKLRSELDKVSAYLDSGEFKGLLIPLKNGDIEKKDGVIQGLVLEDKNNRYICLCKNPKEPTWDGADIYKELKGFVCKYLSKCTHCQQCIVTLDTLPYIIDRTNYLEMQKELFSEDEFEKVFGKEYKSNKTIINIWPNQEQLDEAMKYAVDNFPLLPSDLKVPGFN